MRRVPKVPGSVAEWATLALPALVLPVLLIEWGMNPVRAVGTGAALTMAMLLHAARFAAEQQKIFTGSYVVLALATAWALPAFMTRLPHSPLMLLGLFFAEAFGLRDILRSVRPVASPRP